MPNDYDYRAAAPNGKQINNGSNLGSGYGSEGRMNPFSAPQRGSGYGQPPAPQSPFINAKQRSAPQARAGAINFTPAEAPQSVQHPLSPAASRQAPQSFPPPPSVPAHHNIQVPPNIPAPQSFPPPPNVPAHQNAPIQPSIPAPQSVPAPQSASYVRSSDTYRSGAASQPQEKKETWTSEFDGFSRISQQQPLFNARRNVADVFTEEQLQQYDRQQFSELHYVLQTKLKRSPKDLRTLLGIALCNLAIGEPQKSAEYFAKATDVDEAVRPSKYLNEVPTCDPDDWLDMAEELGHFGILDGSMELCSSIVESNQFSDRVRRQAMKVREVIQQDYFAARERIIIGNNVGDKKNSLGHERLFSALTFIVLPLLLAATMGGWLFYSINMNNGMVSLSHAIYRMEHLKRGDTAVERMGSCDNDLADADSYFHTAMRFNPFTKKAYFYAMQTALMTRELGKIRSHEDSTRWSSDRWQEVKANYAEAKEAYDALQLSTEKDLDFKKEWQDFAAQAKKEENSAI